MPEGEDSVDEWDTQGTAFIRCSDAESDDPYVDGPLARSEYDLPDGPVLRFQAYRQAWDKCLRRVKEIVYNLQRPVVDAVVESVTTAYTDTNVILPSCELVSLVVSSHDRISLHEVLARISSILHYDQDLQHQKNNVLIPAAILSRLSESDCTNVKVMMKSLINRFISQPVGDIPAGALKTSSSLSHFDMKILETWYIEVKHQYGSESPTLVVLIQDLNTVDPNTLQDVLEICSLHVPSLPLVFILGTSEPELLHSLLPRSTLACLRVTTQNLPLNKQIFEHVIRETYFTPKFVPDIMLGPVGFEKIFQEFKRQNATLDAVLSTLQLLHMQHFYHPLSFLVHPDFDALLCEVHDPPPEDWMPFLKLLRQNCISSLVDSSSETPQAGWSELRPQEVIRTVLDARKTFRVLANKMKLAMNIVETLLTFARGHGKKVPSLDLENIGMAFLRGSMGNSDIMGVLDVIKQLNLNEAKSFLEELYLLLHNVPRGMRHDAMELKQKVVVAKNNMTEDSLMDTTNFLGTYLKNSLGSFEDIPCIDIWWTGELSVPHSPLNPNPRMSIVTALLDPQEYLGWDALASSPDACVLFRRYVDSGRMINVYDWFDSFSVAVESDNRDKNDDDDMDVDETPTKGRRKRVVNTPLKEKKQLGEQGKHDTTSGVRKQEIQARFMRSLHELEYLGFVKHTGRKADHLVKTVFDVGN